MPAVLLALGALGAAALILSEFSTLFSVSVPGRAGRHVSGHHQHGYALLIAASLALWLLFSAAGGCAWRCSGSRAWGCSPWGSR